MARYRRRTRIEAPLSAVWSFQSRIDGLQAVTPSWMRLRVEGIRGPNGHEDPEGLPAGTVIHLSVRPFGVGSRQTWTSRIVEHERGDDAAWFVDEMVDGPFPRWVHTHRVTADGDASVLTDVVEFELPHVPDRLSAVVLPGFELLFAYRHRRTRRLVESAGTSRS